MSQCIDLDARGLLCPLPVIRTQNALNKLKAGDVIRVLCSDPGALHDIPAWCRVHGHKILRAEMCENEDIVIEVEKLESE